MSYFYNKKSKELVCIEAAHTSSLDDYLLDPDYIQLVELEKLRALEKRVKTLEHSVSVEKSSLNNQIVHRDFLYRKIDELKLKTVESFNCINKDEDKKTQALALLFDFVNEVERTFFARCMCSLRESCIYCSSYINRTKIVDLINKLKDMDEYTESAKQLTTQNGNSGT
jgi:hypothetical protein